MGSGFPIRSRLSVQGDWFPNNEIVLNYVQDTARCRFKGYFARAS